MKRILSLLVVLIVAVLCVPVWAGRKPQQQSQHLSGTINLALTSSAPEDKYPNLAYGVQLNFRDDRANSRFIHVYDASATQQPDLTVNPAIQRFVPNAIRQYMRTMGFRMDSDPSSDYFMEVELNEFHADYLSGVGWSGVVLMTVKVTDHEQKTVFPATEVEGRSNMSGSPYVEGFANHVINQAFAEALKDVDWDRIAFNLHKPKTEDKTSSEDKIRKTPIFWSIESRPQGADIYWRVSSSTDEVKNQTSKYLGTTQYEATEALNIKGLTFDNASEVEIVIKCEKDGYASQTKKVNVSSALDEKEILMFFKLVKNEE